MNKLFTPINLLFAMIAVICVICLHNSPAAPKTYRLLVCRDSAGVVVDERMLLNDSRPILYQGCRVEVRDSDPD